MAARQFTITENGEDRVVSVWPKDTLLQAREDRDSGRIKKNVDENDMVDMIESNWRLAWRADTHGKSLTFEDWLDNIEHVEAIKNEDDEAAERDQKDQEDKGEHLNPLSDASPASLSQEA